MDYHSFKRLKSLLSSIVVLLFLLLAGSRILSHSKGERHRWRKAVVEEPSGDAFGLFVNQWSSPDGAEVKTGSGGGGGFTSIFTDLFDSETETKIKNYHSMEDDNLSDLH